MEIPSFIFIVLFLPISLLGYYLLSFSRQLKNAWLLLVSLVFYGWKEPALLLFLLVVTLLHYGAGLMIGHSKKMRKILVWFTILVDILFFLCFKNMETIQTLWSMTGNGKGLLLSQLMVPLGLGLMVLRGIGYVTDVYIGEEEPEKNIFRVLFYMSFFPFVAAGPLISYHQCKEQLMYRQINSKKFAVGCTRFVQGLGKKLILADNLANISELVFHWSRLGNGNITVPVTTAWLGILAFGLQIYLEISGYCDMAIGLGMLFGFELPENFDFPYLACGITDFWKKWNKTLVDWFRKYIYLPLGGESSVNGDLVIRNLALTCILFALWHGQSWGILFCGLWHFVFLVLERFLDKDFWEEHKGIAHWYTLLHILIGWVLFTATDIYQAYVYLKNMFGMSHAGFADVRTWFLLKEYWVFLTIGVLLCFPISKKVNNFLVREHTNPWARLLSALYPLAMAAILLISLSYCMMAEGRPFVYF